jgi:predicted acylesterase/phospholipase RssA
MISKTCSEQFKFDKEIGTKKFDLVFEGGGAKGTVFVGALQELKQRGISGRRFVGTSAGAITATLLAAGYSADGMLAAVIEKTAEGKPRFSTFMDTPAEFDQDDILQSVSYKIFDSVDLSFIPERAEKKIDEKIIKSLMKSERYRVLFSFVERGGLYEGRKFIEWFREKLDADCRNLADATLKEFYEKTGNELTVVASDTTAHQKLVLNRLTAPDCPVAWAVRMSMSIPFVWQEVRWQKNWGRYRGDDITGHTVVDGGVLSNFPMNLVTGRDDEIIAVMGATGNDSTPQFGLLIDETLTVPGADATARPAEKGNLLDKAKELKTIQRVLRLVDTMTDANDQFVMSAHPDKICRLPAKGYGTTEFDMTDERVRLLVKAGQESAKACLDRIVK